MIGKAGITKDDGGRAAMASKQAKIIEIATNRSTELERRLQKLEENIGTIWHLRVAVFVSNMIGVLVLIAVWLAVT